MKPVLIFFAVMGMGICSSFGQAKDSQAYDYQYAKVTAVQTIIRTMERQKPKKRCWNERIAVKHFSHKDHTPVILGAIVGAAIGNSLGHKKSNKRVGAVAGTLLGGSIGNSINEQRERSASTTYHNKQQCEITHDVFYEEQVVGYKVSYRFRGMTYHTRTTQHPGRRIKLRLTQEPIVF